MKSSLKRSIGEVVTDYGARVMKVFKKGLLGRSLFDFYGDVKADKLRVKESASVPATPIDKDGGVIYIKSSDGKLYYKSNEVAEVELSTTSATTFVMEDGDGTEVTLSQGKEIKFVEGTGIDIDFTDVSTGSDADPYDITISSDLEGTEVKSTGESGGSKFLREDGDGTCSWQTPTDTNTTYSEATSSAEGLMSTAHHDKLDGIEAGATADQTQADINGLAITTVGTIDTGVWNGTAIDSAYLDSDTMHLSINQTVTGAKTFERQTTLDGNKSVTAGSDGVALHVDAQDITDQSTSGSGTATTFNQVVVENPRLMATNSSVTTTNASTVYIKGAPVASTNQTITNAYALYVAAGLSYFGGDISLTGNILPGITEIKILPRDFIADDGGRPAMIDDTGSDRWLESHGTLKLYANVEIPLGFKATHVHIYGSATSAITVYEADVNSKTVTSKGTGNIGTQINMTDVNSDATNYILIELAQASGEEVYGGIMTIAKI